MPASTVLSVPWHRAGANQTVRRHRNARGAHRRETSARASARKSARKSVPTTSVAPLAPVWASSCRPCLSARVSALHTRTAVVGYSDQSAIKTPPGSTGECAFARTRCSAGYKRPGGARVREVRCTTECSPWCESIYCGTHIVQPLTDYTTDHMIRAPRRAVLRFLPWRQQICDAAGTAAQSGAYRSIVCRAWHYRELTGYCTVSRHIGGL